MLQKYDFYNANIGDSIDDIKAINGIEIDEEDLNINPEDNPDTEIRATGKFFDLDCFFNYSFEDNKLYRFYIHSLEDMNPDFKGDKAIEIIDGIIEELDKKYGKPEVDSIELDDFTDMDRYYESENVNLYFSYTAFEETTNLHASVIVIFEKND